MRGDPKKWYIEYKLGWNDGVINFHEVLDNWNSDIYYFR